MQCAPRIMRKKKIEKLSSTLDKILSSRGMQSRISEYRIFGQWEKTVGEAIAGHARPAGLRGRKLTVAVDSSVWMQELALRKPDIIEKINAALGKDTIQSIVLRLGEIPPMPKVYGAAEPPPPLSPGERARIESITECIKDDDVRAALRRLMERDARQMQRYSRVKSAK